MRPLEPVFLPSHSMYILTSCHCNLGGFDRSATQRIVRNGLRDVAPIHRRDDLRETPESMAVYATGAPCLAFCVSGPSRRARRAGWSVTATQDHSGQQARRVCACANKVAAGAPVGPWRQESVASLLKGHRGSAPAENCPGTQCGGNAVEHQRLQFVPLVLLRDHNQIIYLGSSEWAISVAMWTLPRGGQDIKRNA